MRLLNIFLWKCCKGEKNKRRKTEFPSPHKKKSNQRPCKLFLFFNGFSFHTNKQIKSLHFLGFGAFWTFAWSSAKNINSKFSTKQHGIFCSVQFSIHNYTDTERNNHTKANKCTKWCYFLQFNSGTRTYAIASGRIKCFRINSQESSSHKPLIVVYSTMDFSIRVMIFSNHFDCFSNFDRFFWQNEFWWNFFLLVWKCSVKVG